MKRFTAELLVLAGVALVVYAIFGVVFNGEITNSKHADSEMPLAVAVGDTLPKHEALSAIPVPLDSLDRSIIIVVDSECSISQRFVTFHASLLDEARANGITTLLLRAPRNEPSDADELSNRSDHTLRIDPRELGLEQTPTILLLEAGRISAMWVGRLFPRQRQAVIRRSITGGHTILPFGQPPDQEIVLEDDAKLIAHLESKTVLDIRQRDRIGVRLSAYGAKHIPQDELSVRAPIELDSDTPVVLDCSLVPDSRCVLAGMVLKETGFTHISLLDRGVYSVSCPASVFVPTKQDNSDCADCSSPAEP